MNRLCRARLLFPKFLNVHHQKVSLLQSSEGHHHAPLQQITLPSIAQYHKLWSRAISSSLTNASESSDESAPLPRSKRFNFIADAAEIASPAVAHISISLDGSGTAQGSGSGFVVTDYGVILTNAHVVDQATSVSVKLPNAEVYKGEIIDVEPVSDLAIVQINPQEDKLRTVSLGNSATVRPGEWVVALGSPLNLSNTVTAGIVSAVHRGGIQGKDAKSDMRYIQTDATINQGNSGGPLINLDGEVIGINTMTLRMGQSNINPQGNPTGISFAVPIDRAKAFLLQALETNDLRKSGQRLPNTGFRPYIGLKMMTITPQIEHHLQQLYSSSRQVPHGVLVVDVIDGSPSERSGMRPYDIIIEADGVLISDCDDVHDFVSRGREFQVTIERGLSERVSLLVTPRMLERTKIR